MDESAMTATRYGWIDGFPSMIPHSSCYTPGWLTFDPRLFTERVMMVHVWRTVHDVDDGYDKE